MDTFKVLLAVFGLITTVCAVDQDIDQAQFDARVADAVERILANKRLENNDNEFRNLQKRVTFLENKVKVLEARERRHGGVFDRLLDELATNRPNGNHHSDISDKELLAEIHDIQTSHDIKTEPNEAGQIGSSVNNRIYRAENRVLMRAAPQQVAFTAYLDQLKTHIGSGSRVMFNRVYVNDGNAYDVHQGIFTAPVDGVYLLTFQFAATDAYMMLSLEVSSGHKVVAGVASAGPLKTTMGGNTVVYHMVAGQQVWLKAGTDTQHSSMLVSHYEPYVTFSGVLLY